MKTFKLLFLLLLIGANVVAQQVSSARLPVSGRFRVIKYNTTGERFVKLNDVLYFSRQQGLRHYRNGKLLNSYKIVPGVAKRKRVAPCLRPPCPEFIDELPVWYIDAFNGYIILEDLGYRTDMEIWIGFAVSASGEKARHQDIQYYRLKKIIK